MEGGSSIERDELSWLRREKHYLQDEEWHPGKSSAKQVSRR
jgi:hypothetical protein